MNSINEVPKYQDYVLDDITGKIKELVIKKIYKITQERNNNRFRNIITSKPQTFQRIHPSKISVKSFIASGELAHKSSIAFKCIKPVLAKRKNKPSAELAMINEVLSN